MDYWDLPSERGYKNLLPHSGRFPPPPPNSSSLTVPWQVQQKWNLWKVYKKTQNLKGGSPKGVKRQKIEPLLKFQFQELTADFKVLQVAWMSRSNCLLPLCYSVEVPVPERHCCIRLRSHSHLLARKDTGSWLTFCCADSCGEKTIPPKSIRVLLAKKCSLCLSNLYLNCLFQEDVFRMF